MRNTKTNTIILNINRPITTKSLAKECYNVLDYSTIVAYNFNTDQIEYIDNDEHLEYDVQLLRNNPDYKILYDMEKDNDNDILGKIIIRLNEAYSTKALISGYNYKYYVDICSDYNFHPVTKEDKQIAKLIDNLIYKMCYTIFIYESPEEVQSYKNFILNSIKAILEDYLYMREII